MTVRIVRLGSSRHPDEGIRIGTVRRGQDATPPAAWSRFAKRYRSEMSSPESNHALELLAVLSRSSNFSVGCYCEDQAHWHRSVLRALLVEKGGKVE